MLFGGWLTSGLFSASRVAAAAPAPGFGPTIFTCPGPNYLGANARRVTLVLPLALICDLALGRWPSMLATVQPEGQGAPRVS